MLLKKLILPIAMLGVLTACDDIAADDRYQYLEPIEPRRVVLLEEYTGQLCVNCPDAHNIIEQLDQQYHDFIPVSFHCGGPAFSIQQNDPAWGGIVGLATPLSEQYGAAAGVTNALPKGRVDRIGALENPPQWAEAVRRQMVIDTEVQMIPYGYLTDDNTILFQVNMISNLPLDNARLQLWVVENDIKALQMMPDGSVNMDYVHNNVFRADVNGFGGEPISLQAGVYCSKDYTIDVAPEWVGENLSIVAFIYNDTGVLQATRVSFKRSK